MHVDVAEVERTLAQTNELRFVQIAASDRRLYGLTADGIIYQQVFNGGWMRLSQRAK